MATAYSLDGDGQARGGYPGIEACRQSQLIHHTVKCANNALLELTSAREGGRVVIHRAVEGIVPLEESTDSDPPFSSFDQHAQ